jgi:prepilin-type N-terminal cleavage/methylation domain-containing protein
MFTCISKFTKNNQGFSLIEALVATAILTIGLMAIVGTFPFSIKANKGSELSSLASSYARTQLEAMLTTPYDSLSVGTIEARHHLAADSSDPIYVLERESVISLVDANLTNSITDIGMKKIAVTVYWPNRQGVSSSLTLTSLLSSK